MAASTDAQRLIALSLGKIALSRQQRGGINLHKNLLVASVLHKARTTYMMDNFQTLLAHKRSQAEREAAAKMIVETPKEKCEKTMEITSSDSRGANECNKVIDGEVPHGERPEKRTSVDKENVTPVSENRTEPVSSSCDRLDDNLKSKTNDTTRVVPVVTGKLPLSENNGSTNYVSQLPSCRCTGGKRRRSFVDMNESVTEPKKARFDDEVTSSSDSESEYESDSTESLGHERMQTESTQVKNLVDIFSTGFNGLCKENESKPTGHINVIVSADRPISGHQYVLTDISCGTHIKDNVTMPTAIALAV